MPPKIFKNFRGIGHFFKNFRVNIILLIRHIFYYISEKANNLYIFNI